MLSIKVKQSTFEFTSAFDISHKCEKNAQVEYVMKFYSLYSEEYMKMIHAQMHFLATQSK